MINLINKSILKWRDNGGKGTLFIPPPLDDKLCVSNVLTQVLSKNKEIKILVITQNYNDRYEILEYLKQQNETICFSELIKNNMIKVITTSYLYNNDCEAPFLTIAYRYISYDEIVNDILIRSKFKLVVTNHIGNKQQNLNKIYSICPLLTTFNTNDINELRCTTPVEEVRIGVTIPDNSEEFKLLNYYNEYINTAISIFGSFDNIQYARVGNSQASVSATQFCYDLAIENGWREDLDMDFDYNVQFDAFYSPSSIKDRANNTYEIIRNRRKLLCNYKDKLTEIDKIVKEHKDKKILIISKFSDFAAEITKYLNFTENVEICGNYHDNVDPIPAVDLTGDPIYIKSGRNKGERKMMAAKSQKSYNETRFNQNLISVLSTSNAPDKSLSIPVDVIIITSPECEDIKAYLYRLSNITFPKNKILLYSLYITNSAEEKKLQNKILLNNHTITENVKNVNKCDFFIAD